MKYKIGDKVKIRTWKDMQGEYGLTKCHSIQCVEDMSFTNGMEGQIKQKFFDRILEVDGEKYHFAELGHNTDYYKMKGSNYAWCDEMIECLAEDYKEPVPITNRFELLDL